MPYTPFGPDIELYGQALNEHRPRLYITNSYFVPDADFRRLLCDAARRGVDVRILTAGPETDVKSTWYAGRARYEQLLGQEKVGVEQDGRDVIQPPDWK